MKEREILYFKVAGLVIQITFFFSKENVNYERAFINRIRRYYSHFIVNNISSRANYFIDVVYDNAFRVLTNKESADTYICFFKQIKRNKVKTFYALSGLQFQMLIRKVTYDLLSDASGFMLHASASLVKGKAFLFLGKSGAGKSTTMRILSSKYKPLGDDSVIIKRENGSFYCYSSTAHERNDWFFKNYQRSNLGAICLIKKSLVNVIELITDKEKLIKEVGQQLLCQKEDIPIQMANLMRFVQQFNNFYTLKISLKDSDELVKLIRRVG